jgi:hypothetical protein
MEFATTEQDALLREAFSAARTLEPSDSEVARVLLRAADRPRVGKRGARRGGAHLVAPALATLAILVAVAYAVPPTRAAIDYAVGGVAGIFDGWGSGRDSEAPGRAVTPDESAPSYFRDYPWATTHVHDPRVIAASDGYKLFAYRERSGSIGFDLGDTGVGMGGYAAADFRRPLCLLGPGTTADTDPRGPVPFFGVAAPAARTVAATYSDGSTQTADVGEGGFVILVDRSLRLASISAFDAAGNELGRAAPAAAGSFC